VSYPKDLDEYTDEQLVAEIDRRRYAESKGLCSYCGYQRFKTIKQSLLERQAAGQDIGNPDPKKMHDGPCRFPDRHGEIK
jgi:hypothetical protein